MAATGAIRRNAGCKTLYLRLTARGRAHCVAFLALLQRPMVLVNALVPDDRAFVLVPPVEGLA